MLSFFFSLNTKNVFVKVKTWLNTSFIKVEIWAFPQPSVSSRPWHFPHDEFLQHARNIFCHKRAKNYFAISLALVIYFCVCVFFFFVFFVLFFCFVFVFLFVFFFFFGGGFVFFVFFFVSIIFYKAFDLKAHFDLQ